MSPCRVDGRSEAPLQQGASGRKNEETRLNSTVKQLVIWVLLITAVDHAVDQVVGKNMGAVKETTVTYSELMNKAQAGQVKKVVVDGTTATGTVRQ